MQNTFLIILIMSCPQSKTKIQVRLGQCVFKAITEPMECSFTLKKNRITSPHSPWKHPVNNTISFNSFLRIQVDEIHQNDKCSISLFSRSEGGQILLGETHISLSQSKCGKVRKYPIKNDGLVVATIEVSLYLFYFDHSLPLLQKKMNEYSSHIHYSADHHEVSLQKMLKRSSQKINAIIRSPQKQKTLSINKEIGLMINQNNEQLKLAQNIVVKLFEQIKVKTKQLQRQDAELLEKNSLIQHIKVKQMMIQNESKKINRLKNEAKFILSANQELIRHDDRYDEQFYAMKEQKQKMQAQMATINSQASLKLMCLKAQLENTNKQLDRKQNKIKATINQIQKATKILNTLKQENKEKQKIIAHLRQEIRRPSAPKINLQQRKQEAVANIFEMLANQFDRKLPQNQENIETLPSDMMLQAKPSKLGNQCSQKRCKTLSIVKPHSSNQQKSPSKQKFRGAKVQIQGNKMRTPNIIQYIMNLGAHIQSKI